MLKSMVAFVAVVVVLTVALPGAGFAEDRDASLYVGTKTCGMCHKKEADGNQLGVWQAGPHAKAIETLGTDEAKAVAAKQDIADATKDGKCLNCHSTAYNLTEEVQTEKVTVEDGVSCESCHGPGKNYKSKKVMEDKEKSIAAGMVSPATESCTLCHNDKSPTWNPERYTTKDGEKVGFDVEQAAEKVKHPKPKS